MAFEQLKFQSFLTAAAVLILTGLLFCIWNKSRRLPPGPWGLPFIGYYPYISNHPYKDLYKLSKKYGNVISFRTLGGNLLIVLNGTKTIKEIFINRADEFIGRPRGNNLVSWVSEGHGIVQEEGAPWKEQRRFFLHNLKNFGVGKAQMETLVLDEIQSMLQDLKITDGKPLELFPHVAYLAHSVISEVLFSKKFEKNDPKWLAILHGTHSMAELFAGNKFLLVGWAFDLYMALSSKSREVTKARDFIWKTTNTFIEEHMQSFDPSNVRDYVDVYLFKRNELLKSGKLNETSFSMERLQGNCLNIFFEGIESVSIAAMGLLAELSKHLDVQRKVQKEMDSIIGRDRLPSWTDRQNLPYLDATMYELYRVASPFLISTQLSNFEETTIEGYRIPRRSSIIANFWTINIDPVIYPEPEKFNPERFLSSEGKRIKSEIPPAFGIGITQEDGIPWKEQRRFFLHNLKNIGVGKAEMENHIADEIRSVLKILRKNTGRSTEIQPHLAYVTSSIVSQIVFSSKLDRNDPRMPKILRCGQGLRELFVGRTNYLVGWIQDLYATISPTHRKAIKDRDYVRKITDAFIDERLTSFDPDHIKDYVDVYLSKRNELLKSGKLNESSFSMERLQAISFNLFFEGMESVSSAIMGMLIELSKHLNVQCEAQKEIDNVVGRERLPSWSDRLNLPYLDSTIQELYRFAAPFLVTTQYSNFEETTIEGYRIPRRSVIVSNLWSMNLDPDVFEEPEKFNPRRYLNSEGRRIKISGPYPFGLGKRSCVGESFAQIEVFLIIASLLQNFELHPGDDDESLKLVER